MPLYHVYETVSGKRRYVGGSEKLANEMVDGLTTSGIAAFKVEPNPIADTPFMRFWSAINADRKERNLPELPYGIAKARWTVAVFR